MRCFSCPPRVAADSCFTDGASDEEDADNRSMRSDVTEPCDISDAVEEFPDADDEMGGEKKVRKEKKHKKKKKGKSKKQTRQTLHSKKEKKKKKKRRKISPDGEDAADTAGRKRAKCTRPLTSVSADPETMAFSPDLETQPAALLPSPSPPPEAPALRRLRARFDLSMSLSGRGSEAELEPDSGNLINPAQ